MAFRKQGLGELEALVLLRRALDTPKRAPVVLGIGDDCALLSVGAGLLAWTIDASIEDVHFRRAWLGLDDVGYRALQAAVSDLAAMGAEPIGALCDLTLPPQTSRRKLALLAKGQAKAAQELGCAILGGNIARGPVIALSTSVLGRCRRPLRRDGARPGDELWLIGDVGLSALGLALCQRKRSRSAAERVCIAAWKRPRALLGEGRALVGRAHACIDVSDGLAGDAGHIARASGVALVIDEVALGRVLRPELRAVCEKLGRDPTRAALYGGEDYALLAAGPARRRPRFARVVGRVEKGRHVWLERADQTRVRLGGGFDHLG
jgi:thiamine-monophosphate kinase